MGRDEKVVREKRWRIFKNFRRFHSANGGYYFDETKGFIVKYNGNKLKKDFKKLNAHYKRRKCKELLNKNDFDNLHDKFKKDVWTIS